MQPDIISNNSRSVKNAFEILDDDENCRHNNGVRPVAPLKRGDQQAGIQQMMMPMYGIIVRMTTSAPITGAKFRPKIVTAPFDEDAIDQAHQKLAPEVRGDVTIDFQRTSATSSLKGDARNGRYSFQRCWNRAFRSAGKTSRSGPG